MTTPQPQKSLLPTAAAPTEAAYAAPNYSFSDALPVPGDVGVHRGDSLSDVVNAVKGAAYYVDMIGFGEPSGALTQSMGNKPKPLGINYFMKTGLTCSNGQPMWYYMNGIPTGNSLGTHVQKALASSGLPQLRGLAPGILEDAEDALNPMPLMNAVLGSGYPKCRKATLPVGDTGGNLGLPGEAPWIVGPVERQGGRPYQTHWVQDVDRNGKPITLTKDEYDAEPKIKEGFSVERSAYSRADLALVVGLVAAAVVAVMRRS